MRKCCEKGIALTVALIALTLICAMVAGLAWLVMTDQKLGGNYADRQRAFYGAEAGLEALTASLENAFNAKYALTANDISTLTQTPPSNIPNVQFIAPGGSNGSGYTISFTPDASGNPASSYSTLTTGPYAGLVALSTKYNLAATARTAYGSEAKLQRKVQTVAIPVFQFGVFSQGDLDFFAEPPFNFGGRVHTNGNLWLAELSPNTLTISNKVTAAGEIITSNLENGVSTSGYFTGPVNITTNPGSSSYVNLLTQSPPQSVTGTSNSIASIGPYNPAFATLASGTYNGNIGVKETGVRVLDLSIATPNIGGQTIDLIRRPVAGEDTSKPAKFAERYYGQVSLRILLSDYGPDGTCNTTDIRNLPGLSPNGSGSTVTPVDLATL
ncbi:MAG TPA: pilus assembly PilX N-terminal domain-containing protein, partial [Candidatus Dormibacteraeota bacterium]|nr:pilus assembly PilX N-terminal domain-containing protein [Candidatus Dormibacteraeota bacterium]